MSDFFREVDEELRRDQLQKAWARYGNVVLAVAALVVAATGGYRFWQWYEARTAAAAGEIYYNAVRGDEKAPAEVVAALGPVADGGSGFANLARMRIAGAESKAGEVSVAAAAFDAIASDSSVAPLMRDVARVRAAHLLVDTATLAEMKTRVEALTAPDHVLRHSAREAIGMSAYRTGDYAEAAKWFDAIMSDRETPQDLRNRTELMQSLLTSRIQAAPSGEERTVKINDANRSRGLLRKVLVLTLAAASLSACSPPREMPNFGNILEPFRAAEPKVPGERRDALPATGGSDTVTGEPVSLPPAQAMAEWPNPGGPATNDPGNVASGGGSLAYAVSVGTGSARRQRLLASPIVHQGYVVTMDSVGVVSAFSLSSGARAWSVATKPENERGRGVSGGGVAGSDGRVFVATAYNSLMALDVGSGALVWTAQLSAPARSAPTVAGGRVYVVSATNVVHAFSTADGSEAWTFTGIPETAGILAPSSPAVSGNRVIVPYSSGEIIGFDATEGKPVWSDQLTGQSRFSSVSGIRDVAARPVVSGDTVYAVGVGGRLAAVEVRDGNRLWGANIASASTPAVAGNTIFVATLDDRLVAVSRSDGSFRWAVKLPKEGAWVGPLLAGNALWLASSSGHILRANPVDGSTISDTKLGKAVLIPPIAASGRVLILDDSGRLNVFN